ncbi:MAG: toxin-antitoxin system YwqK family antitoxin [Flavobacteriaceae bacterium]|jgi:antitoxin component YwqK of YwqJK toxin-antitoxin module|nr:toxin-antitoxin system YwqK family antitoxin [Flavobacteriaceae bacterium]
MKILFLFFVGISTSLYANTTSVEYRIKDVQQYADTIKHSNLEVQTTEDPTGKSSEDWRAKYGYGAYVKYRVDEEGAKGNIGKVKEYYNNGKLKQEMSFKNGLPEGEAITYHDNGVVQSTEFLKAGKVEGVVKEFDFEGNLIIERNFVNDVMEGACQIYFFPGILTDKMNYHHGKLEGERTGYYPEGNIKTVANYKNGELDGKFIKYNRFEEGILREGFFKNGKMDGEFKSYHDNGKVRSIAIFKDDMMQGNEIIYDEAGNKVGEVTPEEYDKRRH